MLVKYAQLRLVAYTILGNYIFHNVGTSYYEANNSGGVGH